jgi:hypothetical protein
VIYVSQVMEDRSYPELLSPVIIVDCHGEWNIDWKQNHWIGSARHNNEVADDWIQDIYGQVLNSQGSDSPTISSPCHRQYDTPRL